MPNSIKLVLHSHCNGRDLQNTFYYLPETGTPGPGDTTNLAIWFRDNVLPFITAAVTDDCVFDMLEASSVEALDAPVDQIILSGVAGQISGEPLPDNKVLRFQRVTDPIGGKVKRGHWNLSGLPEAELDGNQMSASYQSTQLGNLIAALSQTAVAISGSTDYQAAVVYSQRLPYIREAGVTLVDGGTFLTTFQFANHDPQALGYGSAPKISVRGFSRITGTYPVDDVTVNSIDVSQQLAWEGLIGAELEIGAVFPPESAPVAQWSISPVIRTLRKRTTRYESAA